MSRYDRAVGGPLIIASAKGGVTIEDIAEKDPSCIIKEPVDIAKGLSASQALGIATKMQFGSASATKQVRSRCLLLQVCKTHMHVPNNIQAAEAIQGLYQMFIAKDCTMVLQPRTHFINPDFSLSKTFLSTHISHSALSF